MPVIRANYVRISGGERRYDKLHRISRRKSRAAVSDPTRAVVCSESADDFDLLL